MKLESTATVLDFDPFTTRVEDGATHAMGEAVSLADGRRFRYGKAGGSNISKGKLQQAPAIKTNHQNITATAAAATGSVSPTFTLGATAATAGEYNEGYMCVNDQIGVGQVYKISSHAAVASSGVITLNLFDPINVALTTASQVDLVHNAYNAVIEATTQTGRFAGVPLISILTGDFGWFQSWGIAAVLNGAAVTLGAPQIGSGATAGAVVDQTDNLGASAENQVGVADIVVGVSTEYNPITLRIS